MLFLLIHLLLLINVEADGGGCLLYQEERTVRCANASLAEVAGVLRTLLDPPHTLEVIDCRLQEEAAEPLDLPSAVETVRLLRCQPPLFGTTSINDLDLSGNGWEELPRLQNLSTLRRLRLRGNRLSRLRPSHLPASLRELDLADNRLGVLADHGKNGYTLKGSLPLSEFHIPSAGSLTSLSLSGNRLASLPEQLAEFRNLRTLDLSRNELRGEVRVPAAASLEDLDLRSNRVTGLSPFHAPRLRRLDITENPLHCDCGATWLLRLSNATTFLLPPCHTPDHRKGSTLAQIADDCKEGAMEEERHEVEHVTALSYSEVEVRWRGGREAVLVYRREGDNPPRKMTLVPSPSSPAARTQTIRPLLPSTTYVVCVARASTSTTYTVDQSKCKTIRTLPRPAPRLTDVSASETSVRLRWRMDDGDVARRRDWRIRVARGGSRTELYYDVISSAGDGRRLYEYAVTDLSPRTDYDVCVEEAGGDGQEACVAIHTEGADDEEAGIHTSVGVAIAAVLCALVVGVAAVVFYRRRSGVLPPPLEEEEEEEVVEVAKPRKLEEGVRNYARSWNTLRLPSSSSDHHPPPPLFRSFRSPCGYRDHLTSVTIYSSGHSEC